MLNPLKLTNDFTPALKKPLESFFPTFLKTAKVAPLVINIGFTGLNLCSQSKQIFAFSLATTLFSSYAITSKNTYVNAAAVTLTIVNLALSCFPKSFGVSHQPPKNRQIEDQQTENQMRTTEGWFADIEEFMPKGENIDEGKAAKFQKFINRLNPTEKLEYFLAALSNGFEEEAVKILGVDWFGDEENVADLFTRLLDKAYQREHSLEVITSSIKTILEQLVSNKDSIFDILKNNEEFCNKFHGLIEELEIDCIDGSGTRNLSAKEIKENEDFVISSLNLFKFKQEDYKFSIVKAVLVHKWRVLEKIFELKPDLVFEKDVLNIFFHLDEDSELRQKAFAHWEKGTDEQKESSKEIMNRRSKK
ncbi:MAG: hypothetical protein SNF33_07005 [Candidatus Algichlamydia australiensis]|nr:hypothetical protein [Chlamydiales bacterium]